MVTLAGGPEVDADTAGEMLTVAARLGVAAEELGHASDMAVADTVVARLREVVAGTVLEPLPDARLRDLAAGAAGEVAVSARGELYRVGMSAERALRMSAGALIAGGRGLHPQTVQRRVRARFPAAAPVPDRPALDELLSRAGVDLRWDGSAYVAPLTTSAHASTSSSSHHAERTADLGRVDATLRRSLAERGFLALAVPRRYAGAAVDRLTAEHARDHARRRRLGGPGPAGDDPRARRRLVLRRRVGRRRPPRRRPAAARRDSSARSPRG